MTTPTGAVHPRPSESGTRVTYPAAVDPFARRVDGWYIDPLVAIARRGVGRDISGARRPGRALIRTPSFELHAAERLYIRHGLREAEIDDGLAERIRIELVEAGWISGSDLFERILVGIVLSMNDAPLAAWELFYRNQRRALRRHLDGTTPGPRDGDLAQFARIYDHADALVPRFGSVLEVGSCFGFLALRLAERRDRRVTASDVCAPAMRLVGLMAPKLGIRLDTRTFDARCIAAPDGSADTVVLVHLLEHLTSEEGDRALAEATRVARHRVIIAVPFEDVPTEMYGHRRIFTHSDLEVLGHGFASGWQSRVEDAEGGWLILDRRHDIV
ncbi:mycofactocin oligosaccharide methyltransferase MftM [Dietzia sp.]|uniref:mycofactocin oligosaccharide methyltransferase MftM n=1 Tax=Dietzia sp. TaxID=1871616 RepID=UPI002FDA729A